MAAAWPGWSIWPWLRAPTSPKWQRRKLAGLTVLFGYFIFLLQREAWRERKYLEEQGLPSLEDLQNTIPNSQNHWTTRNMMLVNPNGGIGGQHGALCHFGLTINSLGIRGVGPGAWPRICREDSDGDGTTNGEELGDPCCEWRPGRDPYRVWNLSHPGRTAEHFTDMQKKEIEPEACGVVWTEEMDERRQQQFLGFYYQLHASDLETDDALFWLKVPLILVIVWLLCEWGRTGGLWRDFIGVGPAARPGQGLDLTRLERAQVLIAAYLWTDGVAGLTHLTFDFCPHYFPVLGHVAKGFQFHHYHPSAWVVVPFFTLMTHSVPLLGAFSIIFMAVRPRRAFRLFWTWTYILCFTTALTHRWCHIDPAELPLWFRSLQRLGLLMTHEHHQAHHLSLVRQFSNLSGVTDFILDGLTQLLPAHLYQHWTSITLLYFLLPIVVGSEAIVADGRVHCKKVDDEAPLERPLEE